MKCIKSTSVSIAVLKQTWWKIFNCPVTNCVISQALSDTPVDLSFFLCKRVQVVHDCLKKGISFRKEKPRSC